MIAAEVDVPVPVEGREVEGADLPRRGGLLVPGRGVAVQEDGVGGEGVVEVGDVAEVGGGFAAGDVVAEDGPAGGEGLGVSGCVCDTCAVRVEYLHTLWGFRWSRLGSGRRRRRGLRFW